MSRRRIGAAAATLGVVAAGAGFGTLLGGAPARADTSLAGWTAQADANTVDIVVDNTAGLDGLHPLDEIDIPEDTSNYETGPLGYALATIFWPGSVGGNIGSLSGEISLPSQIAPLFGSLNDTVKAESYYPAGPTSASYPSGASSTGTVEMSSQATASESWAKAGVTDVTVPGLLSLQDVQGSTTATATTEATATASGSFHSLSLFGGLIQIGATSSTATADSNGSAPSGTATTHLGAITVAGYPASVGSDGLVLGPVSSAIGGLLDVPESLVGQLLSDLNLKVTLLPETQSSTAPAEDITSGGLSISFALPSSASLNVDCTALPSQVYEQLGILCDAPQDLQGLRLTLTVGRVTAEAVAAPPFASSVGTTPTPAGSSAPTGVLAGDAGLSGGGLPSGGGVLPTGSGSVPSGPGPVTTPGAASRPSSGALAVALSSPVTVTLLVGLLALAALVGLGLRRLVGRLGSGAAIATACPLEEAP